MHVLADLILASLSRKSHKLSTIEHIIKFLVTFCPQRKRNVLHCPKFHDFDVSLPNQSLITIKSLQRSWTPHNVQVTHLLSCIWPSLPTILLLIPPSKQQKTNFQDKPQWKDTHINPFPPSSPPVKPHPTPASSRSSPPTTILTPSTAPSSSSTSKNLPPMKRSRMYGVLHQGRSIRMFCVMVGRCRSRQIWIGRCDGWGMWTGRGYFGLMLFVLIRRILRRGGGRWGIWDVSLGVSLVEFCYCWFCI